MRPLTTPLNGSPERGKSKVRRRRDCPRGRGRPFRPRLTLPSGDAELELAPGLRLVEGREHQVLDGEKPGQLVPAEDAAAGQGEGQPPGGRRDDLAEIELLAAGVDIELAVDRADEQPALDAAAVEIHGQLGEGQDAVLPGQAARRRGAAVWP